MGPPSVSGARWHWTDVAMLVAPLALGVGLTRFVTPHGFKQCGRRPSIQPPGWAFGVAWTALYALAGVALAISWREVGRDARSPRVLSLAFALGVMMLWWVVFSNVCRPTAAFFALLAVLALVVAAAETQRRAVCASGGTGGAGGTPWSALLLTPLIAWLCFASVLQYLSIPRK